MYVTFLQRLIEKQVKIRNNKKVLVQINSGIGDSILTLLMIHALSSKGYEVHAIVNKNVQAIARLCPDIGECYTLEYGISRSQRLIRQIWALNKLQFRYFIGALPSNLIRDAFLPIILRIPIRIKHTSPHKEKYRNYDFLFNKVLQLEQNKNNTESNLQLLSALNEFSQTCERKFNIKLPMNSITDVRQMLFKMGHKKEKLSIGIHPGCKETWAFKRWPSERFADLISLLGKQKNCQIILFGGTEEIELTNNIIQNSSVNPLNLTGKLSLEETACAISLCNMFVSNDSGLMHMATVFDIPVIGLFGPTSNEIATGPYGDKHIVIKKSCLSDIAVDEVYKVTEKLLDEIDQNQAQQKWSAYYA